MLSKVEMSFVERVFSAIDVLDDERCVAASAKHCVSSVIAECGYEYFTITHLPQPSARLGPAMLLKVWPECWLAHYDASGYYRYDPVGQRCFEDGRPFLWAEATTMRADQMAVRVMNEAADHGLRYGYCVPMHGHSGSQAVASYAGFAPELPAERRKALRLLSVAVHDWAQGHERPCHDTDGVSLSPRERDVLTWAALGLTNSEVAERLGISALTVRTHLDRARAKLGGINTVNTVVEAYRRREIRL